jgi:pimeloyl-ACP methyl ester carboxylesterase
VRVLWGMADTAFDNEWQLAYLASRVAPSQLQVTRYPAASHCLAQELPEEVARQVAAFVRGAL